MATAHWGQVPALAWTHAMAFGGAAVDRLAKLSERPRSDDVAPVILIARRFSAIVALPLSVLMMIVARVRNGLYAGPRSRSLITMKRGSPWLDAMIIALLLIGGVAVTLFVGLALATPEAQASFFIEALRLGGALAMWVLLAAGVFLIGLGWLQALEKVMSEQGIPDDHLTWNHAAIDKQILDTYDVVHLDGWWHVFNK